jgi:hypothetical protein
MISFMTYNTLSQSQKAQIRLAIMQELFVDMYRKSHFRIHVPYDMYRKSHFRIHITNDMYRESRFLMQTGVSICALSQNFYPQK